LVRNDSSKITAKGKKILKKLICALIIGLELVSAAREADGAIRAEAASVSISGTLTFRALIFSSILTKYSASGLNMKGVCSEKEMW
jgi:hypothetical protein